MIKTHLVQARLIIFIGSNLIQGIHQISKILIIKVILVMQKNMFLSHFLKIRLRAKKIKLDMIIKGL